MKHFKVHYHNTLRAPQHTDFCGSKGYQVKCEDEKVQVSELGKKGNVFCYFFIDLVNSMDFM